MAKSYTFLTQSGLQPLTTSLAKAVKTYLSAKTKYPARSNGRIFLSYLSAKSVACNRLKVVGVSSPFFFPFEVISLTISDEFHSVKNTGMPSNLSHFSSNLIWVDLPEPSIPSTTISVPGTSNLFCTRECFFIFLYTLYIYLLLLSLLL